MNPVLNDATQTLFSEFRDKYSQLVANRSPDYPRPEPGKPELLIKEPEETSMYWLRCMPIGKPRRPSRFWIRQWCNYHVAFGQHAQFKPDESRSFDWFVGFAFAPGNSSCGGPRYAPKVHEVLRDYVKSRRSDWYVVTPGDRTLNRRDWSYLNAIRRFYNNSKQPISGELLAATLFDLVDYTYPLMRAL